eukprot:Gregarina_sp_Poly_1__7288@NODE_3_length_27868_cov_154_961188_g2_i0_p7_GENE_NODE_3_length_27868_cov_154_961188_g2_i0NODE_3_length_27868_cov_154_961188_g2_i0_p7_ORF_typecomplete_len654_score57_22Sfi1/PF08457_10/1_1e03Sfi1/PF08457_10/0_0003Sfi1/PF08457_10/0_14_NODE_3_length_27868_cov_154_961188_g2_i0875710718
MRRRRWILQRKIEERVLQLSLSTWAMAFAARKRARRFLCLYLRIQSRSDLLIITRRWRRVSKRIGRLEEIENRQFDLYTDSVKVRAFQKWREAYLSLRQKDLRLEILKQKKFNRLKKTAFGLWAFITYERHRLQCLLKELQQCKFKRVVSYAFSGWTYATFKSLRNQRLGASVMRQYEHKLQLSVWGNWLSVLARQFLIREAMLSILSRLLESGERSFQTIPHHDSSYLLTATTEPTTSEFRTSEIEERELRLNELRRCCLLDKNSEPSSSTDTSLIPRSIWSSVDNAHSESQSCQMFSNFEPSILFLSDLVYDANSVPSEQFGVPVVVPLSLCIEALHHLHQYLRSEMPVDNVARVLTLLEESLELFTGSAVEPGSEINIRSLISRLFAARFSLEEFFLVTLVISTVMRRRWLIEWRRGSLLSQKQQTRCDFLSPRLRQVVLRAYVGQWLRILRESIIRRSNATKWLKVLITGRAFRAWVYRLTDWGSKLKLSEDYWRALKVTQASLHLQFWQQEAKFHERHLNNALFLQNRVPHILIAFSFKRWQKYCRWQRGFRILHRLFIKKIFWRFRRATKDRQHQLLRIKFGVHVLNHVCLRKIWRTTFWRRYTLDTHFQGWHTLYRRNCRRRYNARQLRKLSFFCRKASFLEHGIY